MPLHGRRPATAYQLRSDFPFRNVYGFDSVKDIADANWPEFRKLLSPLQAQYKAVEPESGDPLYCARNPRLEL